MKLGIKEKYAYILPAQISIALFAITPILFLLYIGSQKFAIGFPWRTRKFVGLKNFVDIFQDGRFWNSIGLTFLFVIAVTFLSLIVGLAIALIVNREFKFKAIVVSSMLIPSIIPPSILGLLWKLMYSKEYGVINYFLSPFGISLNWLGPKLAFLAVVITSVWLASSFMSLVSLAGLESIPPELYEAAAIDGAGPVQGFFGITLPMLKPVLGIAVMLQQVGVLHIFGIVYILTRGGPGDRTNVLALFVYRTGRDTGYMGLGAAMAVVLAVIALFMSLALIKYLGEEL